MRAQASLEAMIVLAAFAGVFLLLMDNYGNLFDAVMGGLDAKKAEHAAEIIEDAAKGCTDTTVTLELPYEVNITCDGGNAALWVGEQKRELAGVHCSHGRSGRHVTIQNCEVRVT